MTSTNDSAENMFAEAVERLHAGEVVAFPTETVFGLGVDAGNSAARVALAIMKGQSTDKPLQVLIPDVNALAEFSPDAMLPVVQSLAKAFWPGPLTVVLRNHDGGTVGVRVPDHPVIQTLLRVFGKPIAATSANRHGEPECPDADAVRAQFSADALLVLEGDAGAQTIPSTVVRVEDGEVAILREGLISEAMIHACVAGV